MNSPHNFRPLLHSLHPETLLDPSQLLLGRRMSVRRIQTSGETDRGRVGTNSNGRRREREERLRGRGSDQEVSDYAGKSKPGGGPVQIFGRKSKHSWSFRPSLPIPRDVRPFWRDKKKKRKRGIYTYAYAQSVHALIMPDNGGQKRTAKVGERCWPASSFATLRRGRSENPCGSVRVTSLCYMHGGLHGVAEEYIYIYIYLYIGEQQPWHRIRGSRRATTI